ncbi:hypothetical protein HOH87_06840 [bacterium]|jgi:hypothetical protein|nr:hypothetical protein [bacterium]
MYKTIAGVNDTPRLTIDEGLKIHAIKLAFEIAKAPANYTFASPQDITKAFQIRANTYEGPIFPEPTSTTRLINTFRSTLRQDALQLLTQETKKSVNDTPPDNTEFIANFFATTSLLANMVMNQEDHSLKSAPDDDPIIRQILSEWKPDIETSTLSQNNKATAFIIGANLLRMMLVLKIAHGNISTFDIPPKDWEFTPQYKSTVSHPVRPPQLPVFAH